MLHGFFVKKYPVNVAKKLKAKLHYFDLYFFNRNILKYAKVLVSNGRFKIFHIEGHSINYVVKY